jgi:formate dehydrogenase (coenzyme F420) beta subunit
MTQAIRIVTENGDRLAGIRSFLSTLMDKAGIDAMLVPARLAVKNRIMPALVSDAARLAEADPLSPAFPVNAAQQLTRLTRTPSGGRLAAVLRPCEIRAFNELVKLHQGQREAVLIISIDCPGALSNATFRDFADRHENLDEATRVFLEAVLAGAAADGLPKTARACRACIHPLPDRADIGISLFGSDPAEGLTARAYTDSGTETLKGLDLPTLDAIDEAHRSATETVLSQRRAYRTALFEGVAGATSGIPALATYLADCVNCYNCRSACPVCYCNTCVFTTETFRHDAFQYLQWARRKGEIKLPTDTLFFHLTRMAHIACACVGCGQCTNACPNDIPLSDLFTYVAEGTQNAFDYAAGQDVDTPPPMSTFETEEYQEVVGI